MSQITWNKGGLKPILMGRFLSSRTPAFMVISIPHHHSGNRIFFPFFKQYGVISSQKQIANAQPVSLPRTPHGRIRRQCGALQYMPPVHRLWLHCNKTEARRNQRPPLHLKARKPPCEHRQRPLPGPPLPQGPRPPDLSSKPIQALWPWQRED